MARTKPRYPRLQFSNGWSKRAAPDVDGSFSNKLIEFIRSLPVSVDQEAATTNSDGEHTAKRRKLDASSPLPSCHVSKGHVELTRPCSDGAPESYAIKRRDVGSNLSFSLDRDTGLFRINSRTRSRHGSISSAFVLSPEQVSADVAQILRTREDRGRGAGAIWVQINLIFDKKDIMATLKLELHLFWNVTPSPLNGLRTTVYREPSQRLIDTFYPNPSANESASSPMDFYEAAYVPLGEDTASVPLEVPGLEATLFPYQARTLEWLLKREGVEWSPTSGVRVCLEEPPAPVSDASREIRDLDGEKYFLSDVFHTVCSDNMPFQQIERATRGGILAEEMGLGKTLEVLGLISLHRRPRTNETNTETSKTLEIQSGATLIVTPESLRQQWMSELSRHAPGLRCEFYQGYKRESADEADVVKRLGDCDVVVTTYSILSSELHFTSDPPERSRRQERKYERPKSPLVQISWWRLCLDEAQMIENGISQAAKVAHVIPRVNAWGITGTPVKDDVQDLYGLLTFLRYNPLCTAPQTWRAVLKQHKSAFQNLFNTVALRHTKAMVRDQISLPSQHRFVISVPFTAVEEQHYQTIFKEMAEACGVDGQGNPIANDWKPEDYEEEMRTWLNRLRQTALHPEVGAYGRRLLGQNKARPMRTVEEVLEAMIEQSENSIRSDEKMLLFHKLTRGQLFENGPRVKEALSIWGEARTETQKLVETARLELQNVRQDISDSHSDINALQSLEVHASDESSDEDDEDHPVGDVRALLGECRRKLRSALELHHKAVFFCANAAFQIRDNSEITEPESEEFKSLKKQEDEGYEEAKSLRREILSEPRRKTNRLMKKISRTGQSQLFTEIPELKVKSERGIESDRIVNNLESLYDELNGQADVIDEWREHVVQLLLRALVDEEDEVETTGEELGDSAKIQDELMVYVQALRAAIADRQDAMTGQTNELVKYETQTSIRLAKDGEGPFPEKLLELMEKREEIKPQSSLTSMRGAISEFRSLSLRLNNDLKNEDPKTRRTKAEHAIATRQLQATQAALSEQSKTAVSLESEIESFTATMNARLEYYRQLQSVSDSVLPFDGPKTNDALEKVIQAEEEIERKLASAEAKHRYLLHLKEAGANSNEPRICVICQTSFETGVLTVCGHQFCKECMMMWFKAHRNCPVCKRHLNISQLHDITMKPQSLRVHKDGANGESSGSGSGSRSANGGGSGSTSIYSSFSTEKLAEIKNVELDGPSYTSKVDTLVRHLMWLRESDPGAKSIVFSQYKDFLGILATAFKRFRIGFASIDTHGGTTRFKEDPAVEVFLLHARAHSSGLNLVNANHVFLCEPLVNTALELQAIARVDRIGQQHETNVWLYITAGTVEESIYNLSVKRRMEHMGRTSKENGTQLLDAKLEEANTLELEQAALSKLMSKDKSAGELVDMGDLWECLFGNIAREGAQGA